jgi:hypothetical protein
LSNISLKGVVKINDVTLEQANRLVEVFGESAFNKNSEFYINAPDAIFIVGGETNVVEGESAKYTCVTFGAPATVTYEIFSGGNSYMSMDPNTGVLTTHEGAAGSASGKDIVIRAVARSEGGDNFANRTIHIVQRTYPSADNLIMTQSGYIEDVPAEHKLLVGNPEDFTGDYYIKWTVPSAFDGYVEIENTGLNSCSIKRIQQPETFIKGTIRGSICRSYNDSEVSYIQYNTYVLNDLIAEADSQAALCFYNAGLCANNTYITKEEALAVTDSDFSSVSVKSGIVSFCGFKHFKSLTTIPSNKFSNATSLQTVCLPEGIVSIGGSSFYYKLKYINIPSTVNTIATSILSSTSRQDS